MKQPLKWIKIALDEDTVRRLVMLSDQCHCGPEAVAASLLHDVLQEDAEAHSLIEAEPPSPSIN